MVPRSWVATKGLVAMAQCGGRLKWGGRETMDQCCNGSLLVFYDRCGGAQIVTMLRCAIARRLRMNTGSYAVVISVGKAAPWWPTF